MKKMTPAQFKKSSGAFGYVPEGTTCYMANSSGIDPKDTDRIEVTTARSQRMWFDHKPWRTGVEHVFVSSGYSDRDRERWFWVKIEDLELEKLPTVSKEFRSAATAGSKWRFKEDWLVQGYNGFDYTIPAGTEFEISNNKMFVNLFKGAELKCIELKENPITSKAFGRCHAYQRRNAKAFLPVQEIQPYIEQISEGAQRTYWLLEDDDGKKLNTKRFNNVGNVKASIRVRGNLIRPTNTGDEDADYVPEWIDGTYGRDEDMYDHSNGMNAVKYDHATDKELERQDMLEYFTFAKLSTF